MNETNLVDDILIQMPTEFGLFQMFAYQSEPDEQPAVILLKGDIRGKEQVLVRFHSECLTGDIFGSLRCDCGLQLKRSLQLIDNEGTGIIIYLRQEGRGIGLVNKFKAYRLQEQGYDTIEANVALNLPVDARNYAICKLILDDLEVKSIRLITNNPDKIEKARQLGIDVKERIGIEISPTCENFKYLKIKKVKMGHMLSKI